MSNTTPTPIPGAEPVPTDAVAVADDKSKPYKAYASTALTVVVAFVLYWIADEDPFTAKEVGEGVVSALIAGGLVGGGTFVAKNPKKFVVQRRR